MPVKKWFVLVGDEEMGPLGPTGLHKLVDRGARNIEEFVLRQLLGQTPQFTKSFHFAIMKEGAMKVNKRSQWNTFDVYRLSEKVVPAPIPYIRYSHPRTLSVVIPTIRNERKKEEGRGEAQR